MRDKKKIIIGVLCALVAVMAVGYAVLASQLNITGTASVDSTWRVEITNISASSTIGDATSKETPSYTATTVNFNVSLIQPGDSITYAIEISNLGTLDAKVGNINVTADENDAITYTTSGVESGQSLPAGDVVTLYFTVAYNSSVTSQPDITTANITLTVNCEQDLGENGTTQEPTVTYDYVIGDKITFAGSNWYVIKNSTADEDYVTLLKETVLTSSELGEYAANSTTTCTADNVTNGDYGCTTEGETLTVASDTMSYYYSDTCHYEGVYGYTDRNWSGCDGHNDYEGSKVKEYLEGTYINTLGTDNLKEVDGYKVRLITWDELLGDLGYSMDVTSGDLGVNPIANDNVPTWIYQSFGDSNNGVSEYWTMTPRPDYSSYVWGVSSTGILGNNYVNRSSGVRPVINLLKSSI